MVQHNSPHNRHNLYIILIFACSFTGVFNLSSFSAFPLTGFSSEGKSFNLSFFKNPDATRRQEHVRRQDQLKTLESEYEKADARSSKKRKHLDLQLTALEESREKVRDHFTDKKLIQERRTLLDKREKQLLSYQEALKEMSKKTGEHRDFIKKYVGILAADIEKSHEKESKHQQRASWKEFKALQNELEELKADRASLKQKVAHLKQEKKHIDEQRASVNRQHDSLRDEQIKKVQEESDHTVRIQLEDLYEIRQALNREKEEFLTFKKELCKRELTQKEDELVLKEYQIGEKKRELPLLKKRVFFSHYDVELAQQEVKNQEQHAEQITTQVRAEREKVKQDRERVEKKIEALELMKTSQSDKEAGAEKLKQWLTLLDFTIILYDHKIELENSRVNHKKLQASMIDVMQKRSIDKTGKIVEENIDRWLELFRQERATLDLAIKRLKTDIEENSTRFESVQKRAALLASKEGERGLGFRAVTFYREASAFVKQQHAVVQEAFTVCSERVKQHKAIAYDADFILKELEQDKSSLNIWQRSEKALSKEGLLTAFSDGKQFFREFFSYTLQALNPLALLYEFSYYTLFDLVSLFLLIFFFVGFLIVFRWGIARIGKRVDQFLYIYQGQVGAIYLTVLRSFVLFIQNYSRSIGCWLFMRLHIMSDFNYLFRFMAPFKSDYLISLFYLLSIPFFFYISRNLLVEIKKINQRMSFLFFTEKLQDKFLFLLTSIFYTSALLLPLRKLFLTYPPTHISRLADVISGAWTLVLSVLLLFFFGKEDVLKLVPSGSSLSLWVRQGIDRYYYPVLVFVVGLFILMNPYVGYSNLAVYLAVAIPTSLLLIYSLLLAHYYLRKYSFLLFMKEEEDEEDVVDRFEHAKMYYGVFIILTFIGSLILLFVTLTRIWGFDYAISHLWKNLSHDWVLSLGGTGQTIGFIGIITLLIFVTSGFLLSSLVNRFVLGKLFEIFRTAPGAQNTISRILHYLIICLVMMLGLAAIKLDQFVAHMLFFLAIGIGFGLKDLVSDFFAGIWILIERPIEIGNFIETGTFKGTVKKVAVRATTIRTARNFSVVIPNRELVSKPIINWGAGYYAVGFEFNVTLPFHVDGAEMRELLMEIVKNHKMVLRIPHVVVRLDEFTERGLFFLVRGFISSRRVRDQWDIASEVRIELLAELKKRNIDIPFPQRMIHKINTFGVTKKEYEDLIEPEQDDSGDGTTE